MLKLLSCLLFTAEIKVGSTLNMLLESSKLLKTTYFLIISGLEGRGLRLKLWPLFPLNWYIPIFDPATGQYLSRSYPAGNYMFKANNRNTRTRCEVCSKFTIKTPEKHNWHCSGVFTVNSEHISHLLLVFL